MAHSRPSASKKLRKLSKRLKLLRPSLVIFSIGLFLILLGGLNYHRVRILSFNSVPEATRASVENLDVPTSISIPSIQIELGVDPGQIVGGVWEISASNATFLNTSAPPGSGGNTVIYGHNKKAIFGNLPYLSVGQEIKVKTKSGKEYNYKVTEKYFVGPDRVDLVSPTEDEILTVYTCWGIIDQTRVVVKATPI